MKQLATSIFAGLIALAGFSQAPQRMTYQAVVRNDSDALVQNSPVGMRVSILQGSVAGAAAYVETHATQTNQNGLLNIEIGGGTVVTGAYENGIFWAGGPYFLKTEIDPLGGANSVSLHRRPPRAGPDFLAGAPRWIRGFGSAALPRGCNRSRWRAGLRCGRLG